MPLAIMAMQYAVMDIHIATTFRLAMRKLAQK